MSLDRIDRFSDDWYTESELAEMAELVINPSRYDTTTKHICWYHIVKDGEYTGKAILLAVESIVDGQEAINKVLAEHGLACAIGEYGDESILSSRKVEALYMVLEKYQYVGAVKFSGSDRIFSYESWMIKLV